MCESLGSPPHTTIKEENDVDGVLRGVALETQTVCMPYLFVA